MSDESERANTKVGKSLPTHRGVLPMLIATKSNLHKEHLYTIS
jgi:hypothetical protein